MTFSTIVEKDKTALEQIIGALNQFEKERFIAGIQAGRYSAYQIEQTSEMVHVYQSKMNMEARALVKFSETFIGEFATDNNECFTLAERYFNRIRCTLGSLKRLFKKTCPTSRKALPKNKQKPSVFDRSALSYGALEMDAFGLASYDTAVQNLYNDLETLFTTATNVLGLCHQMIEKEDVVREDVVQLRSIYNESCDNLMSSVREFCLFIGTVNTISKSELQERKRNARSMDEFLKHEYHKVPKDEFKKYVWLEASRQAQNEGLTDEEMFLWPDNHDKVMIVRNVIDSFDMIDYVEGYDGKIDSTVLVEFIKWCGVEKQKERRLHEYFCSMYKGKYIPTGWSAVSKSRRELTKVQKISNEDLAQAFARRISGLIQKTV